MAAGRLTEGLNRLGYNLEPSEAVRLLEQMDRGGIVGKDGFLASQIDWDAFQMDFRWGLLRLSVVGLMRCAL